MAYFSADDIWRMSESLASVRQRASGLLEAFVLRTYATELARENAIHGFTRRVQTMARCTENVFDLVPLDLEAPPSLIDLKDATINIQSFIFNAFGALDNLAWIWVCEKEVKAANGRELPAIAVGLGPKYAIVRESFSLEMQRYLSSMDEWFEHLKAFRDGLAHRIPLYIPPHVVHPDDEEKYNKLEAEIIATRSAADEAALREEQRRYMSFRPWMQHSLTAKTPPVVFHAQLLANFATIEEVGFKVIDELDRQ